MALPSFLGFFFFYRFIPFEKIRKGNDYPTNHVNAGSTSLSLAQTLIPSSQRKGLYQLKPGRAIKA